MARALSGFRCVGGRRPWRCREFFHIFRAGRPGGTPAVSFVVSRFGHNLGGRAREQRVRAARGRAGPGVAFF